MMNEDLKKHSDQIERMLKEVEAWEGRKGVPLSSQVNVLREHGRLFRKMLEEVELWKGTTNCMNARERDDELNCLLASFPVWPGVVQQAP